MYAKMYSKKNQSKEKNFKKKSIKKRNKFNDEISDIQKKKIKI
jgi:hypothetical protein